MPIITTNNIRIAYQLDGQGSPLLLIAGLGQTRQFWGRLLPALTGDFRVITFDNRGVGQSDAPMTTYTVEMMAADTVGILNHLGLEQVAVVGHSLGAAIAFELARSYPERVSKLVMASGLYPGSRFVAADTKALQGILKGFSRAKPLIEQGIRIATAPDFPKQQRPLFNELVRSRLTNRRHYQAVLRQSTAGTTYLLTDKLNVRFDKPLALIYGESDRVTVPQNGERIKQRVPQATLTVIPNAGHLVPLEQTDKFVSAIRNFCTHLR